MKKLFWLILVVILFASIPRIWNLGKIPSSMSDDEIRLTYSAYSIWETGKDLHGNFFPPAFLIDSYSFNPIPIYLVSPFVGFFGLNMFWARLPFALAGIISVVLIFTIALQLFKNKTISFLSSMILAFSAWHLQLSRFAYEGTIALMFYLIGLFIFIRMKKNDVVLTLLAMVLFLLAFYSYSGTKLIYLPIILILIWYKLKNLNYKQFLVIIGFILLTFSTFAYLSKYENASSYGSKQFFFQNTSSVVSERVELERRGSNAPEILKKIFHNKVTYLFRIFVEQYGYAFSPQYLFTSQEASGIFSVWGRGQFYLMEAFLILPGLIYLFIKKQKEFFLVLLFLFIAPLPSGLGAEPITYTIRSSFMLPWLSIIIGAGIYSISCFIKHIKVRSILYLIIFLAYVYALGGYFNQYYFEWDNYGSKYYSKTTQDLARFLGEEKEKRKLILVAKAGFNTFLHYAFYNKVSPKLAQANIDRETVKIDNITFIQDCPDISKNDPRELLPEKKSTYIIPFLCPKTKISYNNYAYDPDRIIRYNPLEEEWYIYRN